MAKSILKGKNWERECVKILQQTTGKEGWRRVPSSGAMVSAQNIQDPRFAGDIFFDGEEEFYKTLVIECKITKEPLTLEKLLSEKSGFYGWVEQAKDEAKGRDWVLLFRYFGSPPFACSENPSTLEKLGIEAEHEIIIRKEGVLHTVRPIVLKNKLQNTEYAFNSEGQGTPESTTASECGSGHRASETD